MRRRLEWELSNGRHSDLRDTERDKEKTARATERATEIHMKGAHTERQRQERRNEVEKEQVGQREKDER